MIRPRRAGEGSAAAVPIGELFFQTAGSRFDPALRFFEFGARPPAEFLCAGHDFLAQNLLRLRLHPRIGCRPFRGHEKRPSQNTHSGLLERDLVVEIAATAAARAGTAAAHRVTGITVPIVAAAVTVVAAAAA